MELVSVGILGCTLNQLVAILMQAHGRRAIAVLKKMAAPI